MDSIKLLGSLEYSAEEREALIDFVLALRKSHIQDFLRDVRIPEHVNKRSGKW